MQGWILLFIAILLEIAGTTSMKLSEGFTRILPSVLIFVFYGLSFAVFSFCLKYMDVSLAYAVWAGLGTAAIAVVGVAYFKEPVTAAKLGFITLIIVGVVGLSLTNSHH